MAKVSDKPSKKIMKKQLEDKIVELEKKLSALSIDLDKSHDRRISSRPDYTPERANYRFLRDASLRAMTRISDMETDEEKLAELLDPDGSARRQITAIAHENAKRESNKQRGTLPKGFGSELKSPFSLIMSYSQDYAKFLMKSKRCLGCKKQTDTKHVLLCHECANNRLSEVEFKSVIKQFNRWGLYDKPFLTKIALKLKLAKVIAEKNNEK